MADFITDEWEQRDEYNDRYNIWPVGPLSRLRSWRVTKNYEIPSIRMPRNWYLIPAGES